MRKYQMYATKATLAGLLLLTGLQVPLSNALGNVQAESQQLQEEVKYGEDYGYVEKADGTIRLVEYQGEKVLETYRIPETVDGKEVSELGTNLYNGLHVKELIVAGHIKCIQSGTFTESKIGKLVMEETNETNGEQKVYSEQKVYNNTTIGEIEFKNTTKIGDSLFSGATIEKFKLPESIEEVGAYAFFGTKITGDITINAEKPYGEGVFFMSTVNGNITITNMTDKEKEYKYGEDNPYFQLFFRSVINGDIAIKNSDYVGYQLLAESEINGEVNIAGENTVVGNYLFRNSKVQKVSMTGTIADITDNAFLNTEVMEPMIIEADVERIGFGYLDKENKYNGAPFIYANLNGLTFKGKVGKINASSFINGSIGHLRLEKGLDITHQYSFINVKMKKVEILGDIGTLKNYTIINSNNDKENGEDYRFTVDIQGDIQNLGGVMKELSIDLNLGESRGSAVFHGAEQIKIQGNIGMIGDSALVGYGLATDKQEIIINGNIGKIGEYAFQKGSRADGVDTVEINGDIEYAGDRAFTVTNQKIRVNGRIAKTGKESMSVAYDIEVRDGIGEIGEEAFEYYGRVDYGEIVNKVPKSIFKNVTKIGESAFIYSKVEDDIVFPETLKEIGDNAFNDTGLTKVKLPKGLQYLGTGAFTQNSLACITIPKGITKQAEDEIVQKDETSIAVYGTEAKGHKQAYGSNAGVTFIENSIFTNDCDKETWGVQVNEKTTTGEVLTTRYEAEPKAGVFEVEASNREGYKLQGERKRQVNITEDEPNHVIDFIYEKEKPVEPPVVEKPKPPVEKPEPPVEKPKPPKEPNEPVEKPEPPVEKPEPPVEKPEPPVEKPKPPVEKPEPPVEKPKPPVEKPEPPVEKPKPPKEPNEPVEQPKDETEKEDKPIQKPIEKEETLNNNDFSYDTEKEETLPKTGTGAEPTGLYGLLLGLLGLMYIRKK